MHIRRPIWQFAVAALLALLLGAFFLTRAPRGDPWLNKFVKNRPPVPIVFTSRSEPPSLKAEADFGEGLVYPGRGLWQAREGHLRLLTPDGEVFELTWGIKLSDGNTLIDVMSPSVSPDGKKIIFAGRKGPPDPGRFRIYEINVDGSNLRQITGGPDDLGCVALPPMRYKSTGDKTLLSDDERRKIDYDDVDPIHLNFADGRIVFVSSRMPDLGRAEPRRSTTLWMMWPDGRMQPLTANRYNDRWPVLLNNGRVAFSLWSHNQEVISADEQAIEPYEKGKPTATAPIDAWLGAFVQPVGNQFGSIVKTPNPVLQVRPLSNGKMVMMTVPENLTAGWRDSRSDIPATTWALCESGLIGNAPSSSQQFPKKLGARSMIWDPTRAGAAWHLTASPSACPENKVVFAGLGGDWAGDKGLGIYLCSEELFADSHRPNQFEHFLFHDPRLMDAEPVAVYDRHIPVMNNVVETPPAAPSAELKLADGTTYRGPSGTVFGSQLSVNQHTDSPGQYTEDGKGPLFAGPPPGLIERIRIYAAHRDRFDDPNIERIPGKWELLAEAPVVNDGFGVQLPAGIPTVLAGFTKEGKVASWVTPGGLKLYGYAGDHYSSVQPGGKHFCIGCHPGHSGLK